MRTSAGSNWLYSSHVRISIFLAGSSNVMVLSFSGSSRPLKMTFCPVALYTTSMGETENVKSASSWLRPSVIPRLRIAQSTLVKQLRRSVLV